MKNIIEDSNQTSYTNLTWIGCLGYSCEELERLWIFPDKQPACPGHPGDDDGNSCSKLLSY